jgi:hypothetical protein
MDVDKNRKLNFVYTVNKVNPLGAGELIELISQINSNRNMTNTQKTTLINKLRNDVGTNKTEVRKKDLDVSIDYFHPLPLTKTEIIKARVKLNEFDKIDEMKLIADEKRNLIESLLFKYREWMESPEAKVYAQVEELGGFEKYVHSTKDWYEEYGYSATRNQLEEKITDLKGNFKLFSKRKDTHIKLSKAISFFKNEMEKMFEEIKSILEIKSWVEDSIKQSIFENFNDTMIWLEENTEKFNNSFINNVNY